MASYIILLLVIVTISSCAYGEVDQSQLPPEFREMAAQIHKTCVSETQVEEDLIKKLNSGDIEDDAKLKCYIKCFMTQMKLMNDKGVIDPTPLEKNLPEPYKDPVKAMIDHCISSVPHEDDLCEMAHNFVKCSYEHDPENFFFL